MLKAILILAVVMLTIYCVVEVALASRYSTRLLPRWLWAFAVITLPVVGPLSWLLFGRPVAPRSRRVIAPDDDEDFLRKIR